MRANHWLLPDGMARGHEFHWSSWDGDSDLAPGFHVQPRRKRAARSVGYAEGSLVASYVHLHFASHFALAENFVRRCEAWKRAWDDWEGDNLYGHERTTPNHTAINRRATKQRPMNGA